jgi:glycosyltransferase involved in cell wall biosynthesis
MNPALHILLVDDYRHANIGGGEHHLLRVASGCREAGYRVGVVCAPGSGLESHASLAGHEVWPVRTGRNILRDRRALRGLFAALSPDIVHVHGFYASLAACISARRAGVPAVLTTIHNMPSAPASLRPGVRGRVEVVMRDVFTRRTARHLDRMVCVVDAVRVELEAAGVPAEKLVTIHNGIQTPVLERGDIQAGESSPRDPLVGSVGRFEPLKGYPYFIEAAALVSKRVPGARFRLVGDGSLRDELEQRAGAAALEERISLPGWSSTPLAEIAAMDVYVASSVTDTTNLTVVEAMALGKPAVVTRVGGLPEVVADGVTGYVVPPRDAEALAARITQLLEDPDARRRMGEAARARFLERFTVERMVDEHLALYGSLLASE